MDKKFLVLLLILLFACAIPQTMGFSEDSLSERTVLEFSPTLYGPTTFDSGVMELWFKYNASDNFDIKLNSTILGLSSQGVVWGGLYLLPEYDFGSLGIISYNTLGIGIGYGSSVFLDAYYSTAINLLSDILFLGISLSAGILPAFSLDGTVTPIVIPLEWLAFYVEIDSPIVTGSSFVTNLSLDIVPGININFGRIGALSVSYSVLSQEIGASYSLPLF